MKKYILPIIIILSISGLYGQNLNIEIIRDENGWYLIVLKMQNNKIDTLTKAPFELKLLDTLVSGNKIEYIYEAPLHIGFDNYFKTDKGWEWSETSGMISENFNRITSAPIPSLIIESRKKREYKIISDDLVSIKVDGVETIKDCNDFKRERESREREYQEWIRNRDKTDKDTIK